MKPEHNFIKIDIENDKITYCPRNDYDGSVTGHIVYECKAWMEENPEERKRLGWIELIYADLDEIEYDKQTQYLVRSLEQVDEYTMMEVFHTIDKSEEMLLLEDMLEALGITGNGSLSNLLGLPDMDEEFIGGGW